MITRKSRQNANVAEEGDWFAIPLREGGGYGVGLIARTDRNGTALGYFFGPKRLKLPILAEIERHEYRPSDAVKIGFFSDNWLTSKKWPILGQKPNWRPQEWPIPSFVNFNEISKTAVRVEYEGLDLSQPTRFTNITIKEARGLPHDGFSGPGAIEIVLTELLNGRTVWDPLRDLS